jgi:hypothetical protein
MFGRLIFFVAGAAVGALSSGSMRGAAKNVITAGLKIKSELSGLAAEAKEDLQDAKAAAEKKPPHTH